ncbi:MAG: sulfotransferase domain-containing protein [Halanaerobiales bacterium]
MNNGFLDSLPYEFDRLRMHLRLIGPKNWDSINKCFIISTGRTGTKFLAKFFNCFDNTISLHEPNPDFLKLAIDFVRSKVNREEAADKIDLFRRPLAGEVRRRRAKVYIESNNRLFSLIGPLSDVFKNFKTIHIVRDGRDYVRSGMSREWYTPGDDEPRLKASFFPDDPYYQNWSGLSRFEKICWRWQKKDGFIYQALKDRKNAITIKFEDIFKDVDHTGLYKMVDFLGLSQSRTEKLIDNMIDKKINTNKSYQIPKWPNWGESKRRKFHKIAGNHMKKYYDYDYEGDERWK